MNDANEDSKVVDLVGDVDDDNQSHVEEVEEPVGTKIISSKKGASKRSAASPARRRKSAKTIQLSELVDTIKSVVGPKDEYDHFGAMIAAKLRELPERARDNAQVAILYILARAKADPNYNPLPRLLEDERKKEH